MSSKRHVRRMKCERKVRFRSSVIARIRAKEIVRYGGDLLTAYPCEFCKGWHLGHAPARIEAAKAIHVRDYKVRQKINAA